MQRPTALRAIRRYWYLLLICAILGAACGGVYAFKRSPVYTATARLSALAVNASNAPSLAGSLEAAQVLAATFARVVQSTAVINPVANALHTTPAWVAAHVSGTPVPTSPFVSISANASTPSGSHDRSQRGANRASAATPVISSTRRRARRLCSTTIHGYALELSQAQDQVTRLKAQAAKQETNQSLTTTGTTPVLCQPRLAAPDR